MSLRENTLKKVGAILRLIDQVAQGDFPHDHSREALLIIRKHFAEKHRQLRSIPEDTDAAIIRTYCLLITQLIHDLYHLIGFLVHSTEVRNAFELHSPFLRLTKRALGDTSKLVISSEWLYSPFTYLPKYGLEDTVLIGTPASESSNALVIPLAGHELGHNVWRKQELHEVFGPHLYAHLLRILKTELWDDFSVCFQDVRKPDDLEDLLGKRTWLSAYIWSLHQCEELFCDFFGIAIFRESFLHAFSYLIAPGNKAGRSVAYPLINDRVKFHQEQCATREIEVPEGYLEQFAQPELRHDPTLAILLRASDLATKAVVSNLASAAFSRVADMALPVASVDHLARIEERFSIGVPATNAMSLESISRAAWRFYLAEMPGWKKHFPSIYADEHRREFMLSDLVFKSLEVLEIETLTES